MRRLWVYPLSALILFVCGFVAWSNSEFFLAFVAPTPIVPTKISEPTKVPQIIATDVPDALDCGTFVAFVRVDVPQGFLNVRPFPTTEYAPIGIVGEGEWVEYLEVSDPPGWVRVRIGDLVGWVYGRYVSEPECSSG